MNLPNVAIQIKGSYIPMTGDEDAVVEGFWEYLEGLPTLPPSESLARHFTQWFWREMRLPGIWLNPYVSITSDGSLDVTIWARPLAGAVVKNPRYVGSPPVTRPVVDTDWGLMAPDSMRDDCIPLCGNWCAQFWGAYDMIEGVGATPASLAGW